MNEFNQLYAQLLPTQQIEARHLLEVYGETIALNYVRAVLTPKSEKVPRTKTTIITKKK
ncbi:MAG: hypothetical protein ACKPEN_22665 [Planktothrix sp.]|uniref:hypothetical protein n=1 Tax=Planktothrix sp. TaxID=3088171 RepID=UPI0038D47457